MIVYARFLSPFGRRVMVWLGLQDRPFEVKALSPMDQLDDIKAVNPGGRIPVLELDDGTRLGDSFAIVDWLENSVEPERRLLPSDPIGRRDAFQTIAHAHAATEKAVAYVYDKNRRPPEYHWPEWQARLVGQIQGALGAVEARLPEAGFLGGERPAGADIVAVLAHDFIEITNKELLDPGFPKLSALAARANALPAFAETHPKLT